MNLIRVSTCLSVLSFILLLSCQQEQAVAPVSNVNSDFTPGKLASVNLAKDFEVNFWEIAPGEIIVDEYMSVDAEASLGKDVTIITNGKDFVEMYKKLAGKNADEASIQRLKQAIFRANSPKVSYQSTKELFLQTSDDIKREGARTSATQATCNDLGQDGYGASWFVEDYIPAVEPKWGHVAGFITGKASISTNVQTGPNTFFRIYTMNGEYSSQNIVRFRHPGSFDGTINPRKIRKVKVSSNRSGTYTANFTNGATCPAIHVAFLNLLNSDE